MSGIDLHDSTGFLVSRLAASLKTALERELAPLDVTAQQWTLMQVLAQLEAATVVTLAGWLSIDVGAASRLIDRLEAKRLVARRRTRTDRRVAEVALTLNGRALLPHLDKQADNVQANLLGAISPADARQLNTLLRSLLGVADAAIA